MLISSAQWPGCSKIQLNEKYSASTDILVTRISKQPEFILKITADQRRKEDTVAVSHVI
jgi:hypothetical protein